MSYDPTEFPLHLPDHIPPRLRADILIGAVPAPNQETPCWMWQGRISRNGYGRILVDGREVAAHRFVYQAMIESVGPKVQLDHLCLNRGCVNPDHLQKVSPRENYRRRDERRANSGEWTRPLLDAE